MASTLNCAVSLGQTQLAQREGNSAQVKTMESDAFNLAPPTELSVPLQLWSTFYYVHSAKALSKGLTLLNGEGQAISAAISAQDFCLGAIEGTISISRVHSKTSVTSTTYNYFSQAKESLVSCEKYILLNAPWVKDLGKTRFREALGPYGDGVPLTESSIPTRLVPLRSIATDPKVIPTGKLVYIPAAKGLAFKTPQGHKRVHDGYFFAVDVGPAIQGNHIDLFIGPTASNPFPQLVKSQEQGLFQAYIVNSAAATKHMKKLHCHLGANACP